MHFHHSQLDHHGPTDQPTDRRTDKASYRDAWTHLKKMAIKAIKSIDTARVLFSYLLLPEIMRDSIKSQHNKTANGKADINRIKSCQVPFKQ